MPDRKFENFFEYKAGDNFNRRNTLRVFRGLKFKPNAVIGKIGVFRSVLNKLGEKFSWTATQKLQ